MPKPWPRRSRKCLLKHFISLATKPDIVRLENRIEPLEMKSESKFSLLPWMIAVLIALAVANFAQQFF